MPRYHVWTDTEFWDEDPEASRAEFLGLFNDVEDIIDCVKRHVEKKVQGSKQSYAVVTMGDMSPAGLMATSGYDPEDDEVEWIGRYTPAEAEKLMPEWEKEYEEKLKNGCWIDTVIDEHPDVGILVEDIDVWDVEANAWRQFCDGDEDYDLWRKCLTKPVKNLYDESALPLPKGVQDA
jgi:hypothetical protein|tara:strand:- start:3953 stop:4486 length:534 start_codon:yes stop_codon:yes gene_type:complete